MKKENENKEESKLEPTTEETPETQVEQPEQENKERLSESKFILINTDITERKLAEQRYKALFDSSSDAIMTLAPPTWGFTSANKATLELFGAKDENEFTSKGPGDVSPKNQPDGTPSEITAKKEIQKAMKDGSALFEWHHMKLDGTEFPATVLLTKVKVGEEEFLQATVRDITEQKHKEDKLNVFMKSFENSATSMVLAQYKDKKPKILQVNKTFTTYYGYTEKQAIGANPSVLKSREQNKSFYQKMWKDILNPKVGFWEGKIINKRKDGKLITVLLTISTIFDEQNQPEYFTANHIDITKRLEDKEQHKAIVDNIDAGILAADPKTKKFLFANKGMTDLTGYSKKEFMNMKFRQLHPKSALPKVIKAFKSQFAGKLKLAKNLPVKTKSGKIIDVDISSTPEKIGNKKVLLGIFRKSETNVCKPAEEKLQKTKKKHKFRQIKKDLKKKPRVKLM
jgi:PAS domain S-box-containing protein